MNENATLPEPELGNIFEVWGTIRPHLEKLCRDNPAFDLKPEHVYDACCAEQADLWLVPEGFLVSRFLTDTDNNERTLFLWVSCAYNGDASIGAKYLSFFTEVAKYTGCKYIEAWSSRKGMERYLAKHGFDLFYRSFRKAV